ncbi:hypothetical protein LTR17_025260 [Elasticomyces elasticus]|nr:hypothetical protein LTR17_025260 [Elasticomyces elasticus]
MGNEQERNRAKKRKYRERVKARKCHLLLLPSELRIRIYEFATVTSPSIRVYHASKITQPKLSGRTCKQIRRECLDVFYGVNTFRFVGTDNGARLQPIEGRVVDACYVPGMKQFQLAQCMHENYYELDVNPQMKHFSLKMVVHGTYDPYDEERTQYCHVNSDTLVDGEDLLGTMFQDEQVTFGKAELKQLCGVLKRMHFQAESYNR